MARKTISLFAELFNRRKRHEKYLLTLCCLAVMVYVGVSLALMRTGTTITHDTPVYEATEHEGWQTEYGLGDSDDVSYDESSEGEAVHSFYDSDSSETDETSGLYVTEDVSSQEPPMPEQSFSQEFDAEDGSRVLTVEVHAPEGALPEGTSMRADWVNPEDLSADEQDAVEKAVAEKTDGKLTELQAVSIAFVYEHDEEITPAKEVTVTFTSDMLNTDDQAYLVHVDKPTIEQGEVQGEEVLDPKHPAKVVDALTEEQLDEREMTLGDDQLAVEEKRVATSVLAVTTLEKVLEASDGESYAVIVNAPASAGVRQSDSLEVTEIGEDDELWSDYLAQVVEATGAQPSFIRLFDIRIVDEGGTKVDIAAPVDVQVELKDSQLGAEVSAVHMGDGGVEVLDANAEGDTVSFVASGFSAYAIVDGPDPVQHDVELVDDLAELTTAANEGDALFLSLPGRGTDSFCSSNLNGNNCFIEVPSSGAAEWFFEPTGDANEYRIYTLDGTTKRYMRNTSGNLVGLTDNPSQASSFEISQAEAGKFYIKLKGANRWLQHSGGGGGIRFYTDNNNAANCKFEITYADSYHLPEDPYELDGKTYGIMRWDGAAMGKAMMSDSSNTNCLDALPLTVMTHKDNDEDKLFIPADSGATMWTFEWVEDDRYYLKTTVDGSTKYLAIGQNGLSMVSSPDQCTPITVVPGTGSHSGQISLIAGGTTLTYSGDKDTGFNVQGGAGSEWLYFVQESELTEDYFMTYTAKKVSVSDPDVTSGTKLIVYTRIWNKDTHKYEIYAIDHDGSLQRCFENGGQIQWVGSKVNTLLWEFTEYRDEVTQEINYYYELYNQYAEKYLAPLASTGQILSDDTIGINLNGRRDGRYYTKIVAWDDGSYAYSGLTVDDAHSTILPCPKSEAIDFYFATVEEKQVDEELSYVKTLDNNMHGITMKIKDFDSRAYMADMMGSDNQWTGTDKDNIKDLLSRELDENGYPTTLAGNNLGDYFGDAREVNHLFIDSIYGSSGYFVYDSSQNFASLQDDNNFLVYNEIGTYDSGGSKPTLKHGQFFPFNDIRAGQFATVNGKNQYGVDGQPLSDGDPRKNERLYLLEDDRGRPDRADCFFGLELEASFVQTPSGLDDWGHDIIYEFTGDDDFWLYVDGQLVIDLGGIHSAMPGSVNFATGEVNVNGYETTLRALFEENYRLKHPTASAEDVATYLDGIFKDGGTVFKDNTTHTMRIFYMERGAGASNLHMRFNLASIRPGSVLLSKELSGVDETETVSAEYPYQIFYKIEGDPVEKQVDAEPGSTSPKVVYRDTDKQVSYRSSVTVGGTQYSKVFMLRPGEVADIQFPENVVSYRIVECGVSSGAEGVYDHVYVNGDEQTGTPRSGHYRDYEVESNDPKTNAMVAYNNHVNEDALRTVTFTKNLYEADGETPIPYSDDDEDPSNNDQTPFDFRLSLGSEFDDALTLANMYTYHVKDPEGYYCTWDSGQGKFVRLIAEDTHSGKTNYDELTDADKERASFTTSMNGAITNIPNGFTVEMLAVLVGTQFKVEERLNELPDGYGLQGYVLNYAETPEGKPDIKSDPIIDSVDEGEDPHVEVRNLKGFGLRVNKTWTDQDYMADREPTYFAVYVDRGGGLELVDGSVRRLAFDESTLYWYYQTLPVSGTTFDQYVIYEVSVVNPVVDEQGNVTDYDNINHIYGSNQHGTHEMHLEGIQKGETRRSQFKYEVEYDRGDVTPGSNVRVDEATNKRSGIVIRKTDWQGNALAGATFELRDENGLHIGTFTSDKNGDVTIAFLRPTVTYTLTETKAPQGYCGLPSAMTIMQEHSETVYVGGVGDEWYDLEQTPGHNGHRELTIKDRPFTLDVVKVDADSGLPLSGVEFSLNKVVVVDGMTTTRPMDGYESLVTDENGIVPRVDASLPPATYELQEIAPKAGYTALRPHLRFKIVDTGAITLTQNPEGTVLTSDTQDDGTCAYHITLPNVQSGRAIQFVKVDVANPETKLPGAKFDLYEVDDQGHKKQDPSVDITDIESNAEGILTKDGSEAFVLPVGTFHLVETEAPAGYNKLDEPVVIYVGIDVAAQQAGNTSDVQYIDVDGVWQVAVWNTSGIELPASGGMGVAGLYAIGVSLIACAGLLLVRKSSQK